VSVIPKEIEVLFRFSPEEVDALISILKVSKLSYDPSDENKAAMQTLANFIAAMSDVQKELRDGA
jgi:hypothetical protein